MELVAISLGRYRCFAELQRLDLRRLTLVYGQNNGGKSAALRALAILHRSVSPDAASAWDGGGPKGPGRGASFRDYCWKGRDLRRFTLVLHWRLAGVEGEVIDELEIGQEDADAPPVVQRLTPHGGSLWLKMPGENAYECDGERIETGFVGVVPAEGAHETFDQLRARLLSLRGRVMWLHGSRPELTRDVATGGRPRFVSANGENAQEYLVSREPLVSKVSGFYERLGRRLRAVSLSADARRLVLDHEGQEQWQVPLVDTGEGMSKVLPFLVALEAARDDATGPKWLVAEDPDTQLHEDAQRALAEHIVGRVMGTTASCVVESHSRTMLLAVQNQVRVGMPSEDVVVVWARGTANGASTLETIELDSRGLPKTSDLRQAFREDMRLAAELAKL